jgi:hypothetical protein
MHCPVSVILPTSAISLAMERMTKDEARQMMAVNFAKLQELSKRPRLTISRDVG